MFKLLEQVRVPTLNLPVEARRKLWFKPFMQSYLVVFIGYLTMYLIRKMTNLSLPDTGKEFGRDHSTVLHSVRKIEKALSDSKNPLNETIRDIMANINSKL